MSWSSRRGASAATKPAAGADLAWPGDGLSRRCRQWRSIVLAACSGGAGRHRACPAVRRAAAAVLGQPAAGSAAAHPTTVTTIGQAYYCVFAHYYAGPVLDDRVLLAGAFAGFTQELDQLGLDQPDATMPALTGHRDRDWAAFAAVYQKVTSQLPASPAQRQELAAATMTAMVASLDNNHARWSYPAPPPGDVPGDLGIMTSPAPYVADIAPQEALPPLFITAVLPGSPAASSGLRPGDIIVSVDGAPPFPDGIISEGVMNLLSGPYPAPRPGDGAAAPARHRPHLDGDPDRRALPGPAASGIRQAAGRGHRLRAAARVLPRRGRPGSAGDIAGLAPRARLRGLILDLRGNGGGDPAEVSRLLGAFIHGAAYTYDCDVHGNCPATYTGTDVPLLHLPLVVLTDRNCASACDAFSGAVKDLRLGTLVGTRTSGIVAAPAAPYLLDDASLIILPARQELSARHELINGIGVAPDYYIPLTADDLSTGHDPDIAKALTLLGGR